MKTIEKVLDFCNEVILYDHYNLGRVISLNHVRNCANSVLSVCDFISHDKFIKVIGIIVDISLMVIDGNAGKLVQGINDLRVGSSLLLCLEGLYKVEADTDVRKVNEIDGKKLLISMK